MPPEFLYRACRYWFGGDWRIWYERCPITARTISTLTVQSETFPDSPLYPGGKFRVSRCNIETDGKAYHSRHGEYFYTEPQPDAFLFPSKQLLETEDYAMVEARRKGWNGPMLCWEEWQRNCWLYATLLKEPLQNIIDRWKFGGESAFIEMMAEVRERDRLALDKLLESSEEARS